MLKKAGFLASAILIIGGLAITAKINLLKFIVLFLISAVMVLAYYHIKKKGNRTFIKIITTILMCYMLINTIADISVVFNVPKYLISSTNDTKVSLILIYVLPGICVLLGNLLIFIYCILKTFKEEKYEK